LDILNSQILGIMAVNSYTYWIYIGNPEPPYYDLCSFMNTSQ